MNRSSPPPRPASRLWLLLAGAVFLLWMAFLIWRALEVSGWLAGR